MNAYLQPSTLLLNNSAEEDFSFWNHQTVQDGDSPHPRGEATILETSDCPSSSFVAPGTPHVDDKTGHIREQIRFGTEPSEVGIFLPQSILPLTSGYPIPPPGIVPIATQFATAPAPMLPSMTTFVPAPTNFGCHVPGMIGHPPYGFPTNPTMYSPAQVSHPNPTPFQTFTSFESAKPIPLTSSTLPSEPPSSFRPSQIMSVRTTFEPLDLQHDPPSCNMMSVFSSMVPYNTLVSCIQLNDETQLRKVARPSQALCLNFPCAGRKFHSYPPPQTSANIKQPKQIQKQIRKPRIQTKSTLSKKKIVLGNAIIKPMNAYNYFFRDERYNIIHWRGKGLPSPVSDWSAEKQQSLLFEHWYEDPYKGWRLHRKTEGKLGFNE